MSFYDLAIIGGGAAGLFAAVQARKRGLTSVIIECNDRVGKKILATGNGRCNLSNVNVTCDKYNTNFPETLLSKYSVKTVISEFNNIGLLTRVEDDRIYPYSMLSSSVLDALRNGLTDKQYNNPVCDVRTATIAEGIIKDGNGYAIITDKGLINSYNVCLCTGSNATFGKPSLNLLTALGHTVSELSPSLSPLPCDPDIIKGLQGIRQRVKASIHVGNATYSEEGEILFKKDSLSGIVIFNLSAVMARMHAKTATVTIDFLPEYTLNEVLTYKKSGLLRYAMHKNINALFEKDKINNAKRFVIPVTANHDRSQAQVISGGLSTHEFNPITLESKLANNIYACGEALDVDGLCGGYNLHWAWISAIAVADSVARKKKA